MILWRDDHYAVVDKPAGVAVHRGWAKGGPDDEPLLQQVRDLLGQYVWLINRLDRGASGCVLFALDAEAARAASTRFAAEGAVDKRYLCITRGHPPPQVTIDHPIPRDEDAERVPAVTHLTRLETFGRYALVEARPVTGRLHQIRRHCKHISCHLIGDVRYGKGEHNRIFREHHGLHRLALHAAHLAFDHPLGGARIAVDAPLAADLVGAIASCRAMYGGDAAPADAPHSL